MKIVTLSPLRKFNDRPIQGVSFIRPMRGCSRAFLTEANDGSLYIVKTHGNRSRPNILANEMLGSLLCEAVGLPVAEWRPIELSAAFMSSFDLFAVFHGHTHLPEPGLHYASKLIEAPRSKALLLEFLPDNLVTSVRNRQDFLGMYLLDVCVKHRDARQAIFVKENGTRASNAVFIDHGNMFGGPTWDLKSNLRSPCHTAIRVYRGLLTAKVVRSYLDRFRANLPCAVDTAVEYLPSEWYGGDLNGLHAWLHQRIKNLPELIARDLEETSLFKERVDAALHVQDPRLREIRTG